MEISFENKVASRGWHTYGKTVWANPKTGELLEAKRESNPVALNIDPYSVAWTLKRKDKLVPIVVGHIPREISRFVWFFLGHGGKVKGTVISSKYQPFPIPRGGLEIILAARFSIVHKRRPILEHLKKLIEENYVNEQTEANDEGEGEEINFIDDKNQNLVDEEVIILEDDDIEEVEHNEDDLLSL